LSAITGTILLFDGGVPAMVAVFFLRGVPAWGLDLRLKVEEGTGIDITRVGYKMSTKLDLGGVGSWVFSARQIELEARNGCGDGVLRGERGE
jgi:hypothetical protein